jgi:hypothetical protein
MAIFTLEEARSLLPRVKEITQHSHDIVEELQAQLESTEHPREVRRLEAQVHEALQRWAAAVKELGVEVKGLWLADFDSGDGYYYCWQLGEDDIEHFHRYETGFAGRRPITLLDLCCAPVLRTTHRRASLARRKLLL